MQFLHSIGYLCYLQANGMLTINELNAFDCKCLNVKVQVRDAQKSSYVGIFYSR